MAHDVTMRTLFMMMILGACVTSHEPVDVHLDEVAPGHWAASLDMTESFVEWIACTDGDRIALWEYGDRATMLASGAGCITAESGALFDVELHAGHRYRFVVVGDRPSMALELLERSPASP